MNGPKSISVWPHLKHVPQSRTGQNSHRTKRISNLPRTITNSNHKDFFFLPPHGDLAQKLGKPNSELPVLNSTYETISDVL